MSLFPILCPRFGFAATPTDVLLLNSYHKGLKWTDDVTAGIESILADCEIHVEYMDTKRYPEAAHRERFRRYLNEKYQAITFDAILSSDDHAFTFLLENGDTLFPETPIIFCGVNNYNDGLLDGRKGITGVVEAFDIGATLEMAMRLHPKVDTIVVINDNSKTGQANRQVLNRLLPELSVDVRFEFLQTLTMADLQARVRGLPPESLVFLMSFNRDAAGEFFDYDTSIRMIAEKCPVPIYGIWDFFLGEGIVGGKLTNGVAQGEAAAQIARRIMAGADAAAIPVVTQSPNRWMFDHHQLKRFGINEGRLPQNSILINRPASVYEKYKAIIWGALAVIAALFVLSVSLAIAIRKGRESENRLRENEEFLLGITSNIPGVVYQFCVTADGQYGMRFVGQKADEIFGLEGPLDTFFENFLNGVHPEDRERFLSSIAETIAAMRPWAFEGRFVKASQETIWFAGNSITYMEGDTILFNGVMTDITESKLAREDIARRQQFLESLLYHAPDAIITLDARHRVLDWNPGAEKIFGYAAEETLGRDLDSLISREDNQEEAHRKTQEVMSGKRVEAFETIRHGKNGQPVHVLAAGSPILEDGKLTGVVVVYTDTTDLKKAEKEVRRNERMLRRIMEIVPSMIFVKNAEGRFLAANQALATSYGLTAEELVGQSQADIHPHPEQAKRYIAEDKRAMESGLPILLQEQPFVDHHGETRWLSVTKVPCDLSEFGEPTIVGIATDITEQRRDKEELKRLRNYLSNIIDSMPSVLMGVDRNDQVTLWNKMAEEKTGLSAGEALGKNLTNVFPRLSAEMNRIRRSIDTRDVQQDQKRARRSKEGLFYEDVTIYPLIADGVEGAVIRMDDVTDKVRMEEMMVQSEKMLSVGGLAAGMAHEINNPLAGMMQTAAVIQERLTKMDIPANRRTAVDIGVDLADIRSYMEKRGIFRMLDSMRDSGNRVADIVQNMLHFARKSDADISAHHASELLDKALNLAFTDYDLNSQYDFKQIEIRKAYQDSLPPISCQGARIQQVLLNILINGAQAMRDDGTPSPCLTLRTGYDRYDRMVRIEIEDNGPGMTEKTRKRIFEPFFTTKPVGVGTGLGLSVSYFIITENHGGEMSVESSPGDGSRFIIRLPLDVE